jgi:hypothetical protein
MTQGILWAVPIAPLRIDPIYPNGKPHHITLIFDATKSVWQSWIGQEFLAHPYRLVQSDRIQVIEVELPSHIPCNRKHPHIMISYVDGATPGEAAELLQERFSNPTYSDQAWGDLALLKCRIEFLEWGKDESTEKSGRQGTDRNHF